MPPTDLDRRLRHALTLPPEPAASPESLASVVAALPRYRARRRAVLAATGASALGVLVLTLGLLVGLRGSTPTRLVQPAGAGPALHAPSRSASCVLVGVGGDAGRCAGHITASTEQQAAANSAPLDGNGPVFSPGTPEPAPSATVRAAPGERVAVSLPRLLGVTWLRVTLTGVASSGPPGSFSRSLPIHVDRGTRRAIAVVPHAQEGRSVLIATGSASCMTGRQCAPTIREWSITIDAS